MLRVMMRFRPLCCVLFGMIGGLALAPDCGAQMLDRDTRLGRASDDFQRGDHVSAWFGFWGLAREGYAAAQFNLGQFYRQGIGIAADLVIARYWYAEAAAQGHPHAQYNLGLMFERGHGTTADLVEAKAWYRRAAAQNVLDARSALDRLERSELPKRSSQVTPRSSPPGLADAVSR
ncbi:MAG: sel1 repeat family protein [Alphaproteobacteria bacterium]|nr:sel1 repeat family protein [Alphaproteobacteria bacterium]